VTSEQLPKAEVLFHSSIETTLNKPHKTEVEQDNIPNPMLLAPLLLL
jgi:hypothetical protein